MQLKDLELVDWESQDPENIGWFNGEGVIVAGMKGMSSW